MPKRKREALGDTLGRLREVYARVLSLQELFDKVLGDEERNRLKEAASADAGMRRVLDATYVAVDMEPEMYKSVDYTQDVDVAAYWDRVDRQCRAMGHVGRVSHICAEILAAASSETGYPGNVLCHGLDCIENGGERVIIPAYPSTALNTVTSGPWERIFGVLRPRWLQLVLQWFPGVFQRVENDSLLQLSGPDFTKRISAAAGKAHEDRAKSPRLVAKAKTMYGRPEPGLPGNHAYGLPRRYFFSIRGRTAPLDMDRVLSSIFAPAEDTGLRRQLRPRELRRLAKVSCMLSASISREARVPYGLLLRKYCPHNARQSTYSQVETLCRVVLRKIFAFDYFGSEYNWDLVFNYVGRFVRLRRFEHLCVDGLTNGLRIREIAWPALGDPDAKMCRPEFEKRKQLIGNFVWFLFHSFLPKFLRTNFYITEMGTDAGSVYYFRHDVWRAREVPVTRAYIERNLVCVPKKDAARRDVCPAQARVVPKPNGGGRIIARFPKQHRDRYSQLRAEARAFLDNTATKPQLSLSAVCSLRGLQQLWPTLDAFRRRVASSGELPPLYFVKTDISGAYDNLNQKTMVRLVRALLAETDAFWMHTVRAFNCRVRHPRYVGKADHRARYGPLSAEDVVSAAARSHATSVIVDNQRKKLVSTDLVAAAIEAYLKRMVIRIKGTTYRMRRGVAQGSEISSMLCNIMLDKLAEQHLRFDRQKTLLLRYVDDFLLISTELEDAKAFLRSMARGFADYGVSVNSSKTVVNFESSWPSSMDPPKIMRNVIPFVGSNIDVHTLQPSFQDHESLQTIASSVSFSGGRPGDVLAAKIDRLVKHRLNLHSEALSRASVSSILCFCRSLSRSIGTRIALMARLWFKFANTAFLARVVHAAIRLITLESTALVATSLDNKQLAPTIQRVCARAFATSLQSPVFGQLSAYLRDYYDA